LSEHFFEEEEFGRPYDGRIVRRLGGYLRPYLNVLFLTLVLVIAAAMLNAVGPLIVREAVDGQIQQRRDDRLGELVLLYLGVLGAVFVLSFGQAVLMTYIGQRAMMDLRLQLFAHLQRMSIAFFDRNPVGRLVTRLTNDVSTLEEVLSQGVVEAVTNVLTLVVIVGVLVLLDWRLALAMVVLLPALIYVVRIFALILRDAFRDQRAWLARLNAYLNECITGMAVVQLFNRQRANLTRFDQRSRGLLDANLRTVFFYALFEPTVTLFNAVTTGVIIWYGGGRVLDETLTLGTLIAFLQYMQRFYWPIRDLSERFTTLQQAMASSERIFGQ